MRIFYGRAGSLDYYGGLAEQSLGRMLLRYALHRHVDTHADTFTRLHIHRPPDVHLAAADLQLKNKTATFRREPTMLAIVVTDRRMFTSWMLNL